MTMLHVTNISNLIVSTVTEESYFCKSDNYAFDTAKLKKNLKKIAIK